ncbi:MAG: hypothetical protein C0490_20970, partial [Marivirga sp.]|nr:hypothetical protein [Marivirga sp.]
MKINPLLKRKHRILAITGLLIGLTCFINLSFTFKKVPANIWSQLGISESTGLENIKKSFLEGYLYSYGASAAKKIAVGDRVAVVNDVLAYSKQYVNSSSFKKEYENARLSSKPVKPQDPKTKEQIQRERIADLNKSIAEGEKSMKTLPPDLVEPFKEVQQMLKDQVTDYENPESPMLKMLADGEQFSYKAAVQQYETNLKTWEMEYPEDHSQMVKGRLEKFLELTKDIDFNAALREEYRMKKFVNPIYERKPDEWKMAFR